MVVVSEKIGVIMKVIVVFNFPYIDDINSEIAQKVVDSLKIDLQDLVLDTGHDCHITEIQK